MNKKYHSEVLMLTNRVMLICMVILLFLSCATTQKRDQSLEARRILLLREIAKIENLDFDQKISQLRKIIRLNPSPDNAITQRAYEHLMMEHLGKAQFINEKDLRSNYLQSIQDEVSTMCRHYYPDKFRYTLKEHRSYQMLMKYYLWQKKPQKAEEIFKDFLGSGIPLDAGISLFSSAIRMYLQNDDMVEVDSLLAQIDQFMEKRVDRNEEPRLILNYIMNYRTIVDYYHTRGDQANALKFAQLYFRIGNAFLERTGFVKENKTFRMDFTMTLRKFAREYNFMHEEALTNLELEIEHHEGWPPINNITDQAVILSATGKIEEARSLLDSYSKRDYLLEGLPTWFKSRYYNKIAWAFYEMDQVDQHVLEIAQKSIDFMKTGENLDTIACLMAKTGNYEAAIEHEKEAITLLVDENQIFKEKQPHYYQKFIVPQTNERKAMYQQRIEDWLQQINNSDK